MNDTCAICGCPLYRDKTGRAYAQPTVEGRAYATEHHYVAERFFGRSQNKYPTSQQRVRIFETCPWGLEGKTDFFCYECHELLLHNPVLLPEDIERFAALVRQRGLSENAKTESGEKLARRINLLNEVIATGLKALTAPS